jgi:hypothetical protein
VAEDGRRLLRSRLKESTLFPILVLVLKHFQQATALFVAQIIDAVPQHDDREAALKMKDNLVPAKIGNNPSDHLAFKEGEKGNLSFLH